MDSKLPSLFPHKCFLDLVDDAWIVDALSDDEIEIPSRLDMDPSGVDSPSGDPPAWAADDKVDRWNDLGLDLWTHDTA